MTREEMDSLLAFADEIEAGVLEIQGHIYATDEEFDDLVLHGLISLENVARTFVGTVKYIDEGMMMEEFETQIKAKPETKKGEATEEDNK